MTALNIARKKKTWNYNGWCIMTSHMHLIIGTKGNALSNIMRDLKRHTSEQLHKAIQSNRTESRREWMLWMFKKAAAQKAGAAKFQFWQPESHPIQLFNNEIAHQKLNYTHYNPVEAGFVNKEEDWKYSSATDYNGGKGLLDIMYLEPLIV